MTSLPKISVVTHNFNRVTFIKLSSGEIMRWLNLDDVEAPSSLEYVDLRIWHTYPILSSKLKDSIRYRLKKES